MDTSPTGIGWVVNQEGKDGTRFPIRFGAKVLSERQRGYAQVKRELWGIVLAVKVDKDYLIGVENRPPSSFGHNRTMEVCTKSEYKTKPKAQRDETPDISVENPNVGKTMAAHRLQENITIREEYTVEETQRQRPLVLFLATRGGGYTEEATTSLTLSLTLSHTLYKNFLMIQ